MKQVSFFQIILFLLFCQSSFSQTPTLQQVTTAGNTTTNPINVNELFTNLNDNIMTIGRKNTITSTNQSYVYGYQNIVNANNGIVVGQNNDASGQSAMTFGKLNYVRGSVSGAFGYANTFSSTLSSHCGAYGFNNTLAGSYTMAVGGYNNTSGENSSGFGYKNVTSNVMSSAFGAKNSATAKSASAFGKDNLANAYMSSAFGKGNSAKSEGAVAFGYGNLVNINSNYAVAFGKGNTVNAAGSVAIGYGNTVDVSNAAALGINITNQTANSLKLGCANSAFLKILDNGFTGIGTENPLNFLHIDPQSAGGILLGGDPSSSLASLSINLSAIQNGYASIQYFKNGSSSTPYGDININAAGGKVNIGTNTPTSYRFQVNTETENGAYIKSFGSLSGSDRPIALYAEGVGASDSYPIAIMAEAVGDAAQEVIGIYSLATLGSNAPSAQVIAGWVTNSSAYGMYSEAIGAGTMYAGWFEGDIQVSGTIYNPSDISLKDNIQRSFSGLSKLKHLKPVDYTYKPGNNFPLGLQHGFIAQEVESIFPELVHIARRPVFKDKKQIGTQEYKSLNYVGLISILTKSVQELSLKIDSLETVLSQNTTFVIQESKMTREEKILVDDRAFSLSQNVPNPFSSSTTIRYKVPGSVTQAFIAVFDLNGKMLLQFNNLKGTSEIVINGNTLQAGMYLYSLVADGEEIITKKMILTK